MDASMMNGNPTNFVGDERYKCLDVDHWPIHWLDAPTSWQESVHHKGNVRYQTCYSVQVLEQMLAEEQLAVIQSSLPAALVLFDEIQPYFSRKFNRIYRGYA